MFGGQDHANPFQAGTLDDFWAWDGRRWQALTNGPRPPARAAAGFHADPATGKVVLVGGWSTPLCKLCSYYGDTWEWDGNDWVQRMPANVPPSRSADYELCFDENSQRVLMVMSDRTTQSPQRETWSWDGTNWTRLLVETIPSNRRYFAIGMAYDSVARKPTLIGDGYSPDAMLTMTWDGTRWTTASAPFIAGYGVRSKPAFDRQRGALVVYAAGELATWELKANAWTRREKPDFPLRTAHLAYDPTRKTLAMVEWDNNHLRLWESTSTAAWKLRHEQRSGVPPQPNGVTQPLIFDETRQRLVLFTHEALNIFSHRLIIERMH